MASILTLGLSYGIMYYSNIDKKNEMVYVDNFLKPITYNAEENKDVVEEIKPEIIEETKEIVYDNMTIEELSNKLNNILSDDLSGMGNTYAKYSIELGVDPYLAVAISMHETGCTWNCSTLLKICNNVGGQKGYGCGEYKAYDTLEDGIYGFILNIKNKYVDYGLLTAEQMNPKYAEDPMWASKVNKYIEKIKNS